MKELNKSKIALLLILNAFTFLVLLACLLVLLSDGPWTQKTVLIFALLYVIPVLLTRIVLVFMKTMPTTVPVESNHYVLWWATSCFQTIYLRFPFLEELLRSVPGLYSLWLRAWGAKIGSRTYWSPGTRILDRPYLEIGNRVVIGFSGVFTSHLVITDEEDEKKLLLAKIVVGDDVVIGGYSSLGPGTVLEPNQSTKALSVSPPFSRWRKGERIKGADVL